MKNIIKRTGLVLLVAGAQLATVQLVQAQNAIGGGDIANIYKTNCAVCHGANLEGAIGSALNDDNWKYAQDDDARAKVIREGIANTEMPAWDDKLSAEDIRLLVIFMHEQRQLANAEASLKKTQGNNGVFVTEDYSFTLEKIATAKGPLWSMDFMPDGSILSTQVDGLLWRFKDGKRLGPITGIPKVWRNGQGGLLEVQLHPEYKKNGWIYLSYSESVKDGYGMTAVVRGKIKNDKWVDQEEIFHVPVKFHSDMGHHFGSRLVFKDGYLFFGIGDRGYMNQAQDVTRPNGKIHRIHDDGRIPKDNPFHKTKDAYPSVWAYGNRNPQGLDKHPVTGVLWETEHGPRGGDETNIIEPGNNYGWPVITYGMNYNGKPISAITKKEGMEQPKHYWVPSIAVCGIDFYEGGVFPKWKNNLMVGGLASQELHRLVIEGDKVVKDEILMKNQGRVRDVANGPDGYLYVVLNQGADKIGSIYKLVPKK